MQRWRDHRSAAGGKVYVEAVAARLDKFKTVPLSGCARSSSHSLHCLIPLLRFNPSTISPQLSIAHCQHSLCYRVYPVAHPQ